MVINGFCLVKSKAFSQNTNCTILPQVLRHIVTKCYCKLLLDGIGNNVSHAWLGDKKCIFYDTGLLWRIDMTHISEWTISFKKLLCSRFVKKKSQVLRSTLKKNVIKQKTASLSEQRCNSTQTDLLSLN